MVQLMKQSNSSQPDNFLNILLNQLVRSESLSKRERACRAQSSQNMRAREQNREHRARGLALKSGLVICPSGAAAQKGGKEKERKKREKRQKNKIRRRNSYAGLQY